MEELTPKFRPLRDNKPGLDVILSLLVVMSVFGSGVYVLAFYLK